MTFDEILDQAIAMLQRRGRVTYRTLKRQFQLDDDALEDLKAEIIKAQRLAVDEDGEVLVWTGGGATATAAARGPELVPLSYTPTHLAEKIFNSRAALEGERKQVTVLFADIKDSTELIRELDPEAAQRLLDPALHHMMDAVHRFEGTVNQVLGDGIMALFGAPIAHEDHALRACYAALAMQAARRDSTEEVRRSHGLEMRIRVGLNAGEVVVRTIRNDLHMDYSAVGETTHLAARMEQGNPFFLEESVRTLVETGVLVGQPGAYRPAQALPTIQVPATVQAVLAARIDRLPPEEKRLLQTAAVIGHEVPLPLLRAIANAPEEALHRSLAQLQGAEFLYETRLFPEQEYTFKHALTHEVAYGSLLQERRRTLHARIVEALEGLAADRLAEQVDRLAHHALRGEVWDKAVAASRQAGAKAMTHSAYHEAVTYFEQALDALQHLPARPDTQAQAIDLRLDLRTALYPLGELERIFIYLQDAAALAEALGDQRRLGWVSAFLLTHFVIAGEPDHALASGQRALAIATDLGDVGLTVAARHYLGFVYRSLGDYKQAMECYQKNLGCLQGELLPERFGMTGLPAVMSRSFLTLSLAECGAFAEGRASAEEGVRIAEATDHPYSRVSAYRAAGFRALRQGDLHQAISVLERALDLARGAHIRILVPQVASLLGAAYALAGRTAEALPLLEQAVEQAVAMGFIREYALHVAWLSEAYLLAGRLDEAHTQAQRTLDYCRAHKERGYEAYALRLLGEVAAQRQPPEAAQAEAHYRPALALAEELGMRPLQAHCHLGLSTLYAKIDWPEDARTELSAAIDLYRAMEMTFWLPQAEAALTQMA